VIGLGQSQTLSASKGTHLECEIKFGLLSLSLLKSGAK